MRRRENGEKLLQANKNKGVFMFCKDVFLLSCGKGKPENA